MKVIVFFSFLGPLSALWSQNPTTSFRRGTFLILTGLFAFYLVVKFSPQDLAKVLVIAGVGAGLLGIAVSVLLPKVGLDAGNQYAWQGIFHSKNGCAQTMLFFLTAAIAHRFHSKAMALFRFFLFPLSFFLIVMANAKTAWIITPAYMLLFKVASNLKRFKRKDATFLALGAFGAIVVLAVLVPMALPILLPALGKDPSMSGRIPLWGAALVSILKRPLLGYGFAAFWTGPRGESLNVIMTAGFEIYQAQNGFLELGLELGLLGLGLMALTVIGALRDAFFCFQRCHSDTVNWYVGILFLTIAYNVDEAFLARENFLPWLLYLVACAGISEEARKVRLGMAVLEAQSNNLRTSQRLYMLPRKRLVGTT